MRSQRIFQRSSLCPTSRSTRFQANLSSSSDALFRSSKGLDRVLIFDASWSLQHSCSPCDGNGSVALLLAHRLRHGVKLIFPNVHLRTVFPMRAWLCSHGLASLSQMPHLVLAYAIPLTSTCSCILSQAIRLNGLWVVSRLWRFSWDVRRCALTSAPTCSLASGPLLQFLDAPPPFSGVQRSEDCSLAVDRKSVV